MKRKAGFYQDLLNQFLFLLLFIYALVYYKERLFADSGYYIYRVIDSNFFVVELNRFILLFSQILPVISLKLGCSLKTILISYSIWHVLFFYILYLVSRYYYKNYNAGILFILLQTIGIVDGYFTPMFELYYGAGFLVLLDVILNKDKHSFGDKILLFALALLVLTSHPFTYFLLLTILFFHFIKHRWKYFGYYVTALILIIIVIIYKNYTATEYEQGKTKNFIYQLQHGIYNWDYYKKLLQFLVQYYKDLIALTIITLIFFFTKKQFIKAVLSILVFIFFLALINFTYYGFEHSRYQEQVYFPLCFIIAFIFVYYVMDNLIPQKKYVIYSFLSMLVIWRLLEIKSSAVNFAYRINTMERLIARCQKLNGNKFIVSEKEIVPENGIGANWSYTMETMLLSSINPNQKTITICTEEDMIYNDNKSKLQRDNYLMRMWDIRKDNSINPTYFHLEDGEYIHLQKEN